MNISRKGTQTMREYAEIFKDLKDPDKLAGALVELNDYANAKNKELADLQTKLATTQERLNTANETALQLSRHITGDKEETEDDSDNLTGYERLMKITKGEQL